MLLISVLIVVRSNDIDFPGNSGDGFPNMFAWSWTIEILAVFTIIAVLILAGLCKITGLTTLY